MEVFAFAVSRQVVHADAVRCQSRSHDVFQPRRRDADVLVQAVVGVGDRAQVRAVGIAAKAGALPVADGVIGVAELLAGDGRGGCRPVAISAGQFIPVVIPVLPEGAVFKRGLGAPVQGVVLVAVRGELGGKWENHLALRRGGQKPHRRQHEMKCQPTFHFDRHTIIISAWLVILVSPLYENSSLNFSPPGISV